MRFLPDIRFPGSVLKRVFSLERRLKEHPEDIEATQALTLNMNRPNLGLCGDCGLYGEVLQVPRTVVPLILLS